MTPDEDYEGLGCFPDGINGSKTLQKGLQIWPPQCESPTDSLHIPGITTIGRACPMTS